MNLRERTIDRRDERTVGNPDFLIHERNLTQTDEKSGLCLGSLSLRGGAPAIRWRGGDRLSRKTGSLTTLYLIRHAQALPLPVQDEPDWALSPLGEIVAHYVVHFADGGTERLPIRERFE